MPVPLSAIRRAQEFLKQHLPQTRLVAAPSISPPSGGNVYLKLETDLPTGSFKPRGALYALSVNLARRKVREVVASSYRQSRRGRSLCRETAGRAGDDLSAGESESG